MNVAFLIDTIETDTAGTQRQLLETIRRLGSRGFRCTLICLYESAWMRSNPLPCETICLGYRGLISLSILPVLRRLRSALAKRDIEVLQTFFEDSIFVAWLATLLWKRRPTLLSSRRDIGLGTGNQPWYHGVFRALLPLVNRSFDAIVVNSERVKDFVAKRESTRRSKIVVQYNGVELPPPAVDSKPAVFGADSKRIWIAFVASLTPVKRHDVFLMALRELLDALPSLPVHAVILGDGPMRAQLSRQAEQLGISGSVHFEGACKDVTPYLKHAHIGVLCSDREGLSNAILEYMANSLPVVATHVGGTPELVCEANGILVPPNDPQALYHALALLCTDEEMRKSRGNESRRIVEERFSWSASLDTLTDCYERVKSGRQRAHS
jgi:glycosyltransferase involved in cell wall biosynthesis